MGSEEVLENFSRWSWKVLGKVLDFFPVKEWEPCQRNLYTTESTFSGLQLLRCLPSFSRYFLFAHKSAKFRENLNL